MGEETKKTIPSNFGEDEMNVGILDEQVIDRDYAKSGSPIQHQSASENQAPKIDRVGFNMDDINFDDIEEEEHETSQEEIENGGSQPVQEKETVVVDKSIQRKIAKSQSKNIVNVYVFILTGAVKWFSKYDETKLIKKAQEGELNLSQLVGEYSILQHIRNGNQYISELTVDEDAKDVMIEALEIYLISQNIEASPAVNLAIAFITPAIQLLMDGMAQKREMKKLINIAIEDHSQIVMLNQQNNDLKSAYSNLENEKRQMLDEIARLKEEKAAFIIPTGSASPSEIHASSSSPSFIPSDNDLMESQEKVTKVAKAPRRISKPDHTDKNVSVASKKPATKK